MTYYIGQKLKFKSEKQRYTIVGMDDRYLICIKPFNLKKTYLYCIVDLKENMRGPDNWLFGKYDLEYNDDIDECLKDLNSGKCRLSRRKSGPLDLETN